MREHELDEAFATLAREVVPRADPPDVGTVVRRARRRRSRRRVATGALTVALLAGGVATAGTGALPTGPEPPAAPAGGGGETRTGTPTPTALPARVLLPTGAVPSVDGAVTWRAAAVPDPAEATVYTCQQHTLGGLGASAVAGRRFTAEDAEVGAAHLVARFPSETAASTAVERLESALEPCVQARGDDGALTRTDPVDVDDAGGRTWVHRWQEGSGRDLTGHFEYAGVGRRGRVVTLVTWTHTGQDSIFDRAPVVPMLREALTRLGPAR